MTLIDILIVLIIVAVSVYSIKRVRASVKEGKCAGCAHNCECHKKKAELEKGYKEWQQKRNN